MAIDVTGRAAQTWKMTDQSTQPYVGADGHDEPQFQEDGQWNTTVKVTVTKSR